MSSTMEKRLTIKVSRVSIIVNIGLTLMKLVAGIAAHSRAMVADAVHSASDVFGSFLVIIGANVSGKEADKACLLYTSIVFAEEDEIVNMTDVAPFKEPVAGPVLARPMRVPGLLAARCV